MSNPVSAPHLPLIRDLSDWDRTIQALANHRVADLLDLVIGGQVLPVPPDADIVVEEDFATLVRVRIASGEARGVTGWLPSGLLPQAKAA